MHILLITPARPGSRSGNRATATRWAKRLREMGHRVDIAHDYHGQAAGMMIALHAWRSAESIQKFRQQFPDRPLIVAITGTDVYRFLHSHPETTIRSMQYADQLVGLHDLIADALPLDLRDKVNVIYQSAQPISMRNPYKRFFHVSVLGHLRDEKDPLRPALAASLLPTSSRIQVHHYGKAHTAEWFNRAKHEMASNARYTWHQEIPYYHIRQVYRRTQLLVLPSNMEGGANVISEAVVAGIPIIASNIEGSIGLLGRDYPGYYQVRDEQALAKVLLRAETDTLFYRQLEQHCIARQSMFSEDQERNGWRQVLTKIGVC